MDESVISEVLGIALSVLIGILLILILIYIFIKMRVNIKRTGKESEDFDNDSNKESKVKEEKKLKKDKNNVDLQYTKESIFDFMEFDDIEDNMIVQKDLKRYVMVVECQGINYDLMSQMEKISVEEGFQQFLNTLRHPIQIYIQTRTINLGENINRYKVKIKELEQRYNKTLYEYGRMQESDTYSQDEIKKYFYELTRQKNLLDYGKDIVSNTEQMSLNKNILNKKYYIVISYYVEENNTEKYDKQEIKNIAFSELYTKSQALIRTLSGCSVTGKILNSQELVELLYMAYNRDDAELYGLNTVLNARYDSLYSTSQDVFEKKLKYLDKVIQEKAIDTANDAIEKAKSKSQEAVEKREESMDALINNLAQLIIKENRQYIGTEVAEQAIKEIEDKQKEEEVEENVEQKENKTSRRGRKRKSE